MAELNQIVEQLSTLSVLEAAELVKLLEEKWGVSAAAPVAMAAMTGKIIDVTDEEDGEHVEIYVE